MSSCLDQNKEVPRRPISLENTLKYIMIVDDEPDILDLLQGTWNRKAGR
jgi:hypothetical protein